MGIVPTGPALALLLISIIFLVLSWIIVILRLIVRTGIKGIGRDDWFMVAGLVFFTITCISTIAGSYNGVGTRNDELNQYYMAQGKKWFLFAQLFYVLSTVPIKAAICVALLRITTRKLYRWILYGVVALASVACIVTDVVLLTWCKPVSATWDSSTGTCGNADVITNVSYFISACSVITDWTCAILPAFILWEVQLKWKVKLSVAIILGVGVIASSATLVRLRYLLHYSDPDNYLYSIADIAIWSVVESGIGIIAGSAPALRPLLKYIPFIGDTTSNRTPGTGGPSGPTGASYKMDTYRFKTSNAPQTSIEGGNHGWDQLSDADSQRYILKENEIKVTKEVVMDVNHDSKSYLGSR
ncbi:cation-transporting atpase 4 [Seiridium cupressi]